MINETISKGIALAAMEQSEAKRKGRTVLNGVDIFSAKGEELTNFSVLQPLPYYKLVRIDEEPIIMDDLKSFEPTLRATKGYYSIQYVPLKSTRVNSKRCRYLIGQDLVQMRISVSGPYHLKVLADRVPEIRWLLRNTTFHMGMFEVAKRHPGMPFPFTIDYYRYEEMLIEKAAKKGIELKKPFVTFYYANQEGYYEKYKDIKFARRNSKEDYKTQIEEADKLAQEAGEES